MKIYFVRHGHTDLKEERRHQFPTTPLSEIGEKQAEFVAQRFLSIPIDTIYSSSYTRAFQTAEAIQKATGRSIEKSDLLIEKKYPSIFFGRIKDDLEVIRIKSLISENKQNHSWHHSDEENFWDFKNRGMQFLDLLKTETSQSIVVVSHGYMISLLVLLMTFSENVSVESYTEFTKVFHHSTTGITLCELENERWSLLTWNDYAHLGEAYLSSKTV